MTCEALTWIPLPPFAHFHSASQAGETAGVHQGPLGQSCPQILEVSSGAMVSEQLLQIDEPGLNTFLNFAQGLYLQKTFSLQ